MVTQSVSALSLEKEAGRFLFEKGDFMDCPCCGREMTSGCLRGKIPLLWTPNISKKTLFRGKEDVDLSQAFFSAAYICKDCQKVVIESGKH